MTKMLHIQLPGGATAEHPAGTPIREILAAWRPQALAAAVAARMDGRAVDLDAVVEQDTGLEPIDLDSREGLSVLRHSTSHVMAQAVQDVFPGAKVSIGPSIEDGFYYDFDYETPFTPEDLDKIEARMREIIAADHSFVREEMSRAAASEKFAAMGETYKVELLRDLPADVETVSLYTQGGYVDLCRGPHLPSTGRIAAFKLLNVAGAYWRGDERNRMLQRIYGTAFADADALAEHLKLVEEARKRDHRRIGRELDLFQMNDEAGPGLIIFHRRGCCCARSSRTGSAGSTSSAATTSSWGRRSSRRTCGSAPATTTTTARTCTTPRWKASPTGSSP